MSLSSFRFVVFACALVAAPRAASAATLDLPGAVRYALAHNATVVSQRATVARAEQVAAADNASLYPSIAGSLSSQLSKSANASGSFASYGLTQQSVFSQNSAQVNSTWNLWNASGFPIASAQARRNAEAARADLGRVEAQTTNDVASAFFALATKRETVRLRRGDQTYQQRLLDTAIAKEKAGVIAGVDVLRARVGVLTAQNALATALADEANSSQALAQLIDAPLDTAFAVPETLPEPPPPQGSPETLVAVAERARPEVASARASLAAARLGDRLIDADRFPAVSLQGAFGNTFSPTAYGSQLNSLAATNAQRALTGLAPLPAPARGTPGFWQVGLNSSLTFPLIEYGARSANHRAARALIASGETNVETAERSVELDVRQSYRTVQTNGGNLASAKLAADLGRESARIAELQYRAGLISLTDAIQAQQTALSSQADLETARVNYLTALVKLRVAIGTTDPIAAVTLEPPR